MTTLNIIILVILLLAIPLFWPIISWLVFGGRTAPVKKETICAFSGFDGQLLKNGVALANEKVIRQYEWADEVHREEATTDENGYFSFESAWEDYEYKIEFNFCVPQEIRATDDLIPIFGGGKLRKHEFSEFNDRRCLVVFETTKPLSNWDIAGNQSLSNGIIKG